MTDFTRLERLFKSILDDRHSKLSTEERNEIRRFIDVGEYGLALETMVNIYEEEKKVPSEQITNLIETLALAMSMNTPLFRERIQKLRQ